MIEKENANIFYVGNHGVFDQTVRTVLRELQSQYSHINYAVVLAYMPQQRDHAASEEQDTILPEEVASAMPKFAISRRNKWMLQKSDTVITYVIRPFGNAAKYKEMAIKSRKHVIEIGRPLSRS